MTQEIEIEFKNMLTKEQYGILLDKFNVCEDMIVRQTNHYFDTPQGHLKNLSSGLRIRETNKTIVCTLKEKTSQNVHLETTEEITKDQAEIMLSGSDFFAPKVKEKLLKLQIPLQDLRVFGSLTTDRVELPYHGGTLVFDHSFYLQCDDYEVEYETGNEKIGIEIFNEFLKENGIEKQTADKKIARFMKALQLEKG